jgi:signal peptidase I
MFKNLEQMTPEEQSAYFRALLKEVRNIALLAMVILTFYSSCYRPHRIPSGSMIPTLMVGDYILVNNFAYGLRFPFSGKYLSGPKKVERGDVIVFDYPPKPNLRYIKRVVALPGESVRIENNIVFINDEPIEQSILDELIDKEYIEPRYLEANLQQFEIQTGEASHLLQLARPAIRDQHFSEITLGDDEYFVMGDNRDFSSDSRDWGPIKFSDIRGKALWVWFSFVGPLSDEGDMRVKWNRIGTRIE